MPRRAILLALVATIAAAPAAPAASAPAAAAGTPSYEIVNSGIAPTTNNRCALRDHYGFIWVGTANGLCCFDGNGVAVYDNPSGVIRSTSRLSINTLLEIGDDIWAGDLSGVHIFDRRANKVTRLMSRTEYGVTISTAVDRILAVGNHHVWIVTQGQGLFIYSLRDGTLVQDSRHGSFYSDMVLGSNGMVYLASLSGQVMAFRPDGQFVAAIPIPNHVTDKTHIALAASGGDVYVASGGNLFRLDTADNGIHQVDLGAAAGTVAALFPRNDGTLLLGSAAGDIFCYNAGTLTQVELLRHADGRNYDPRILAIAADTNEDVILIHPTGALDVMMTRSTDFCFTPLPATVPAADYNLTHVVCPAADGCGLWLGADNGLLYYDLRSGAFSRVALPEVASDAITTLATEGSHLWIGTRYNGVILYDTASGHHSRFVYDENTPYTIVSNEINRIYRTSRGEVYVLTNWGLCRYDANAGNFHVLTEFGQQTRGVDMQEDGVGGIWVATANNGLYYRQAGSSRFERAWWAQGVEGTTVTALRLDRSGRLWAATQSSGVYVLDDRSNDFVNTDIPAINYKAISFMADDLNGYMWIGAGNTLVQVDDKGSSRTFNFSWQADRQPLSGSAAVLAGGAVVVGCRDGFLTFDPGKLKSYDDMIRVYARSISLPYLEDDSEALDGLGLGILLYTRSSISLPYACNTFNINLSAARALFVPDVRYDYMLVGVDKAWVVGTANPVVTYNNIPPGDYRFLLRPHGMKDADTTELALTILPPWFLTKWAIAAYVLLALALAVGVFAVTRRLLRRNFQRRLQDLRIQKERELFEAKSRYFVDLVHEIRTPLMLISLPLEQIAERIGSRDDADDGTQTYLASMQRNIDYLLGITNQLLDFRKAENDSELRLSLTRCDLAGMLRTISGRFDEPMRVAGKELALNLPDGEVAVDLDATKTERLLMNLLGNAMKYARHSVVVTLNDSAEATVAVSVEDDGHGVPLQERDRIFDTYYQIGNDNVAASLGTGLGLAYAKLIAVAHKGDISVADSAAGGAMFTIVLPRTSSSAAPAPTEPPAADDDADAPAEPVPTAAPDAPAATILLVEDNEALRTMITGILDRHYSVVAASDGQEALEMLAAHDVDLIVSDVMMPRMNGMDLCRHVKSHIDYSHIPFIILTARIDREAHEEGFACGADVYLEKPFPMKQLVGQIGNLLRTRQLFYERMRRSIGVAAPATTAADGGATDATAAPTLNRMDAEFLARMNAIIAESLDDEEFSIDVLAERLNMSRSSFYRKIVGVTGMTPSDCLKNFRLNRAAELLADGCRVAEVADSVGFTSSSYFAKCFREKFGVLPSEYTAKDGRQG